MIIVKKSPSQIELKGGETTDQDKLVSILLEFIMQKIYSE